MIEIAFLVNYPEVIPTLTHWFRAQWPEYYAGRTPADIAQDFYSEANRDGLPVRLVAFADGELLGTIILREIEGLSTAESAIVLGITEGAVKVRLHRARLLLREALSGYFTELNQPEKEQNR